MGLVLADQFPKLRSVSCTMAVLTPLQSLWLAVKGAKQPLLKFDFCIAFGCLFVMKRLEDKGFRIFATV